MKRLANIWLLGIVALGLPLVGRPVTAQQIWLAPNPVAVDRLGMFKPDAPWATAASRTDVFQLYANKEINQATQDEISLIIADLNRRGISLAIEAGVINVAGVPRPTCGGWGRVEGYGVVAMHEVIARKIKAAGGTLKYIAMDEPLWYGHYFKGYPDGQPGCQTDLKTLLDLIVPSLNVYVREFPNVQIGDIEPARELAEQSDWQLILNNWASSFRAAMGRPLAFLHLDVTWSLPRALQGAQMVYSHARELVRQQLVGKIGIIYNGNPQDQSDASWVQAARNHIISAERDYGLAPDQAIIQSWHKYPTRNMPDTANDTLTGLVNFYVDSRLALPKVQRRNRW